MLESTSLNKKVPMRDGSRKFRCAGVVGAAMVLLGVFAAVVCISSLFRSKSVLESKMENKFSTYPVYANTLGNPAMLKIFTGNGGTDLGNSEPKDVNGGFELQNLDSGDDTSDLSEPASDDSSSSRNGRRSRPPHSRKCDDMDTSTVVKLTPSQPKGDAVHFGMSVAQLEDTLVVGSNRDHGRDGNTQGAAYVYHRDEESTWNEVQKLKPTDPMFSQMFGVTLLIPEEYPNVLFVHSFGGAASRGVTIFQRNSATALYSEVGQLTVSEESCGNCAFGVAMVSEGTTLMVAWVHPGRQEEYDSSRGAVFVFEATSEDGTGWEQVQKLMAEDDLGVGAFDGFGSFIVLRDEFLAVGAIGAVSPIAEHAGAVYLFEKINFVWSQFAILYPNEDPETSYNAYFGTLTLSEDGKTLAVGAAGDPWNNFTGNNPGTVYIFSNTDGEKDWRLTQQLYGADPKEADGFGVTVRFYEEFLLVGAHYADEGSGAVYVFCEEDGEWEEVSKLSATDGMPEDAFGISLSVEEHDVIIGAYRNNDVGAIYIYEFEE